MQIIIYIIVGSKITAAGSKDRDIILLLYVYAVLMGQRETMMCLHAQKIVLHHIYSHAT